MRMVYRTRPDMSDRASAAGHDATSTTETDAVKATRVWVRTTAVRAASRQEH